MAAGIGDGLTRDGIGGNAGLRPTVGARSGAHHLVGGRIEDRLIGIAEELGLSNGCREQYGSRRGDEGQKAPHG